MEMTMPMAPAPYMGGSGGMFGGDNGWIVFLIIAMLFGWGGNGFGGRGNGFANGELLADQFSLNDLKSGQRHIDDGVRGLERGISDIGFLTQNQGSQTREAITGATYGISNAINGIGSKIDECCCNTLRASDQTRYDMARGFADLMSANAMNTRDILESNCQNTQKILDTLNQAELQRLRDENSALTLQVSQSAQTSSIINALNPRAIPAYITCSPYEATLQPFGRC